jgi:transcriptional repressor NF-X1
VGSGTEGRRIHCTGSAKPWKKAGASEPGSSGDWHSPGTSVLGQAPGPAWRQADIPGQVMGTSRLTALESPSGTSSVPADKRKPDLRTDAGSGAQSAGQAVPKLQPDLEVENWEESCE